MSSKKSKPVATVVPKPKFANGNKVFILCYVFAGPGKILQGEITRSDAYTQPKKSDNGKITSNETFFSYIIATALGVFEVNQWQVYPTYLEAAKVFGENFVEYLK